MAVVKAVKKLKMMMKKMILKKKKNMKKVQAVKTKRSVNKLLLMVDTLSMKPVSFARDF